MKTLLKRSGGVKLSKGSMRADLNVCRDVKLNRAQSSPGPTGETFYRLLEDGDIRLTEDGNFRILE